MSYFGGDVSVIGLLTGPHLLQAHERVRGEFVVMLKSDEAIMLDGMRVTAVSHALDQRVHAINLKEFWNGADSGNIADAAKKLIAWTD